MLQLQQKPIIQPKLKVDHSNDQYEQEADRVADAVMRMPDPQVQMQSNKEEEEEQLQMQPKQGDPIQMKHQVPELQRMCPRCRERTLQGKPLDCPDCEKKLQMTPAIQRQDDGQTYASPEISNQLNASKGQGAPLPSEVQHEMAHKMGSDFSGVNIHTDSKSHQLNQQLGARAFTYGSDIYFNKGEYSPGSQTGKRLLAHELTHVIQQGQSPIHRNIIRREPQTGGDPIHDPILDQFSSANPSNGTIQRQEAPSDADDSQRVVNGVRLGADDSMDPSTYRGAVNIVSKMGALLGIEYLSTIMDGMPNWMEQIPEAYMNSAWDFWRAHTRRRVAGGDITLTPRERRTCLREGLDGIQPLLVIVERVAPSNGRSWLEQVFFRHYNAVEVNIADQEAYELVEEASEHFGALEMQDPARQRAHVLQTVNQGLVAVRQLQQIMSVVSGVAGYDPNASLSRQVRSLLNADPPDALEGPSGRYTVATGLGHANLVLNTIKNIWTIADPEAREQAFNREFPNTAAQVSNLLNATLGILEVTVGICTTVGAIAARVSNYSDEAMRILSVGNSVTSAIGRVAGAFQAVYGVAVLVDSGSTDAERRGALLDIGLGTASVLGSAPLAAGVLVVAGEVYVLSRAGIIVQRGMQELTIGQAFRHVQDQSQGVAEAARKAAAAQLLLSQLQEPIGPVRNVEATPYRAMAREYEENLELLRSRMELFLDFATNPDSRLRASNPTHQPGRYEEISSRFTGLPRRLEAAGSYDEVMEIALEVLRRTRDLLGDYESIAREQRDRANEGSLFFGGVEE